MDPQLKVALLIFAGGAIFTLGYHLGVESMFKVYGEGLSAEAITYLAEMDSQRSRE